MKLDKRNTTDSKRRVYSIEDSPQAKSLKAIKKYLMWKLKPLLDFYKKL